MHRYKVKSLSPADFDKECERLESQVMADGFSPDCIIGIESGGRHVAERLFRDVPHLYTRLQRESTRLKSGRTGDILAGIFRIIPRWCLDRLRIYEAKKLSDAHHALLGDPERLQSVLEEKYNAVRLPDTEDYRRILIVDDAIDSGMTMGAVLKRVRDICAVDCDVRTAVITVTDSSPIAKPDYALFDNNTLIRFPWSIDS